MNTASHPAARRKSGRPPRQRHAHTAAGKAAAKSTNDPAQRWSRHVTESSDALDLEPGVFAFRSPEAIAQSLKESALHSRRRKGTPFQSAMSMLNFYINRAGRNLPKAQLETLEKAKEKLREAFGRKP
ncbi:MAG TPA: DUF3175 domain-containing protein [Paraburkholderia sp.]|nr:DUF3175 domain-containing protein [Paraburkholderia sp.]